MWFSQNLPLSPALEGAYIGPIYHPWGLNVFSVLGLWQCSPRGVEVSVADPGCEERGGRTRFWGLAPKIFWVHFSQFRGLFKEFGEKRGLLPLSILDFTNLCADRGLEVGLEDLLCPSGGGGGANATNAPPSPAYDPASARTFYR